MFGGRSRYGRRVRFDLVNVTDAEETTVAPKRTLLERTAFGAMVTLLGQAVGFFASVQDGFQPFTGQGPFTWVLTAGVLVLGTAAWVFVPRWWKWPRRRPARPRAVRRRTRLPAAQ